MTMAEALGKKPNEVFQNRGAPETERAIEETVEAILACPGGQAGLKTLERLIRNRSPAPGKHPFDTDYWTYSGYRGEFNCPHGVGHGNHIHGCCHEHCCTRADFPLRRNSSEEETPT
jgi:hypothetical protein